MNYTLLKSGIKRDHKLTLHSYCVVQENPALSIYPPSKGKKLSQFQKMSLPPHRRDFFSKDPHPIPLEIPVKLYTFSLNFLVFQEPPPHPPGDFNLFSGEVLIFSGTAHYEIWSIKHTHGNNCKGVYLKGNVCGLFEIICNKCVSQSKEESSAYLIIFHMDQVIQAWHILWPSKQIIKTIRDRLLMGCVFMEGKKVCLLVSFRNVLCTNKRKTSMMFKRQYAAYELLVLKALLIFQS